MPRLVLVQSAVVLAFLSLSPSCPAQSARHHASKAAAPAAPTQTVAQMVTAANAERALLKAIYQAPTADSIASKHPTSRIGAMVLAAKQYEFNPQTGGVAVLAALPRNSVEMEALRQFCAADSDLTGVERYFYGAALESVQRHPQSLLAVLRVASAFHAAEYSDVGQTGDWYCSELAKLRNAIPQQYDRAAQQAPVEERPYLTQCGTGS